MTESLYSSFAVRSIPGIYHRHCLFNRNFFNLNKVITTMVIDDLTTVVVDLRSLIWGFGEPINIFVDRQPVGWNLERGVPPGLEVRGGGAGKAHSIARLWDPTSSLLTYIVCIAVFELFDWLVQCFRLPARPPVRPGCDDNYRSRNSSPSAMKYSLLKLENM